jgi:hypothetical protein
LYFDNLSHLDIALLHRDPGVVLPPPVVVVGIPKIVWFDIKFKSEVARAHLNDDIDQG